MVGWIGYLPVDGTLGKSEMGAEQDVTLWHVAIHEAGHAVALVRLNHQSGSVTIESGQLESGLRYRGKADGDHPDNIWVAEQGGTLATVYAAGYAAMVAHGIEEELANESAWQDFDNAEELLRFWLPEKSLEDCRREALELMREPANLRAVGRVADELLLRGTVDEDHLSVLIDLVDGGGSEEEDWEYRVYLRMRGLDLPANSAT